MAPNPGCSPRGRLVAACAEPGPAGRNLHTLQLPSVEGRASSRPPGLWRGGLRRVRPSVEGRVSSRPAVFAATTKRGPPRHRPPPARRGGTGFVGSCRSVEERASSRPVPGSRPPAVSRQLPPRGCRAALGKKSLSPLTLAMMWRGIRATRDETRLHAVRNSAFGRGPYIRRRFLLGWVWSRAGSVSGASPAALPSEGLDCSFSIGIIHRRGRRARRAWCDRITYERTASSPVG